jgi:hypothetical protein
MSWDKWLNSAEQGLRCGWWQTCLAMEVEYLATLLHVSAHLRVPVHLHVLKYRDYSTLRAYCTSCYCVNMKRFTSSVVVSIRCDPDTTKYNGYNFKDSRHSTVQDIA